MNELFKMYDDLSIEDKKNQLCIDLNKIGELIKGLEQAYGLKSNINSKNYDTSKGQLDEAKFLTFIYEEVFRIEKDLIVLLSYLNKR